MVIITISTPWLVDCYVCISIRIRLLLLLSWVSTYKNPPPTLVPWFSCSCFLSYTVVAIYLHYFGERLVVVVIVIVVITVYLDPSPRSGSHHYHDPYYSLWSSHCHTMLFVLLPSVLPARSTMYVMEDGGGIRLLVPISSSSLIMIIRSQCEFSDSPVNVIKAVAHLLILFVSIRLAVILAIVLCIVFNKNKIFWLIVAVAVSRSN